MNSFDLIASRVIMRARGRESGFHFSVYPTGLRMMRSIIWERTENCNKKKKSLLSGLRVVWNNDMK